VDGECSGLHPLKPGASESPFVEQALLFRGPSQPADANTQRRDGSTHRSVVTSQCAVASSQSGIATSHRGDATSHRSVVISHRADASSHRSDVTSRCDNATSHCNDATSHCDNATSHCNDATSHCDNATSRRNDATSHCDDVTLHRGVATSHHAIAISQCAIGSLHFLFGWVPQCVVASRGGAAAKEVPKRRQAEPHRHARAVRRRAPPVIGPRNRCRRSRTAGPRCSSS
jgi:hypothetical protein